MDGLFLEVEPGPFLWPVVFIIAAGLIAYGTRQDVSSPNAWLLMLPRFVVGWAFLDNGQNDYTWAFNGGNFLNSANAAVQRGPLWFLEVTYNAFLSGVVVGRPDTSAGLFVSGELMFGVLLALGLFTPIAAWGTMWLSANIIMEKSFISHGAYVDKTYFAVELFSLIPGAVWQTDWTQRYCPTCRLRFRARSLAPRRRRCPRARCHRAAGRPVRCLRPESSQSSLSRSVRLWRTAYSAARVRSCDPVLARIAEM